MLGIAFPQTLWLQFLTSARNVQCAAVISFPVFECQEIRFLKHVQYLK